MRKYAILLVLAVASPAAAMSLFTGGRGQVTEHLVIEEMRTSALYQELMTWRANATGIDMVAESPNIGAVGSNNPSYVTVSYQREGMDWLTYDLLINDNTTRIDQVLRAADYAFNHQEAGGNFSNTLGYSPEVAITADAFFMAAYGNAYQLIYRSNYYPSMIQAPPPGIIPTLDTHGSNVQSALTWLKSQKANLKEQDKNATNRLLFDASAFTANGNAVKDLDAQKISREFTSLAMTNQDPSGYWLEHGGYDSGYQGVAIMQLCRIIFQERDATHRDKLIASLKKGVEWLAAKIGPDGRIDDTGNTRTGNNPATAPEGKIINYPEVAVGLIEASVILGNSTYKTKGELVIQWMKANVL